MEEKIIFCPNCKKKQAMLHDSEIYILIREKAKAIAEKYNLEKIIKEKNYLVLNILSKFKKLEENCYYCPQCNWSPIKNLIAHNLYKNVTTEFKNEVAKVEGNYLFDVLNIKEPGAKKTTGPLKKTIQELFNKKIN